MAHAPAEFALEVQETPGVLWSWSPGGGSQGASGWDGPHSEHANIPPHPGCAMPSVRTLATEPGRYGPAG